MRTSGLLAVILAGGLLASGEAATLNVSPTRVTLDGRTSTASVTIRNNGTTPVRFEVSTFAWVAGDGRQIALRSTDALVAYPTVFSIPAGASRILRIGVKVRATETEATYRVLLQEMPNLSIGRGDGVKLLTRLSLPVFVVPAQARAAAALDLEARETRPREFGVQLRNTGSVHLTPERISVVGVRADGSQAWARDLHAWYLLAGERRDDVVQLTPAECRSAARILVRASFQEFAGKPLEESRPIDPASCGR